MSIDQVVTLKILRLELKKMLGEVVLMINKTKREQDETAREYLE